MNKRKIRKDDRKTCAERRRICLLKDVKTMKPFEEKIPDLVDIGVPNLWENFMDSVLEACDEVSGRMMGRRSKGDTW